MGLCHWADMTPGATLNNITWTGFCNLQRQAGDLQDLHSEVQQRAAMLQNVSGLAEEVRHGSR